MNNSEIARIVAYEASKSSVSVTHVAGTSIPHPSSTRNEKKQQDSDDSQSFEDDDFDDDDFDDDDYADDDDENDMSLASYSNPHLYSSSSLQGIEATPLAPSIEAKSTKYSSKNQADGMKLQRKFEQMDLNRMKHELISQMNHPLLKTKSSNLFDDLLSKESRKEYRSAAAVKRGPQKYSPHSEASRRSLQMHRTKPQSTQLAHQSKQIAKKPSLRVKCLVVPVTEPVFPTLAIPDLRIINPTQKYAVWQIAENDGFIGLFYIKDPNFKPYSIVSSMTDIYEYGVLAKITGYNSYTDGSTGLKPLIVQLTTVNIIEIEQLLPNSPKECWSVVKVHNAKFSRKSIDELRETMRKIIKKLSKLYHREASGAYASGVSSATPNIAFLKKYEEILQRNQSNMLDLDPKFDFYKVDNDSTEILNVKLNVVAEILKSFFIIKFQNRKSADENIIKLQYFLRVFQNISENLRMDAKAKNILNILEIELPGMKSLNVLKPSKYLSMADPGTPPKSAGVFDHCNSSSESGDSTPTIKDGSPNLGSSSRPTEHDQLEGSSGDDIVLGDKTPRFSPDDSGGTDETLLSSFSASKNDEAKRGGEKDRSRELSEEKEKSELREEK